MRLAVFVFASLVSAAELRVGAAQVVITPPPGAPMAGYYYNRAADGVHDDLHAKAVVFEKDGLHSAWLLGPAKTVEKNKAGFEAWLKNFK